MTATARAVGRVRPAGMGRWVVAGVAIAVSVVALVAGALSGSGGGTAPSDASVAAAVERYLGSVVPTAREAGMVVELGVKVGIGDLGHEHRTAVAVLREQAMAWRADLVRLRADWAAAAPPVELGEAHRGFLAALDDYAAAATAVIDATGLQGSARDRALDRAVAAGREGDRRYDGASVDVQALRRRLGLPPTADLPDPAGPS